MANQFRRTLRSLEADDTRGWTLRVITVLAFLTVWLAWFWLARVSVYIVASSARLEADQAAHAVESPVAGRVTAITVQLEEWVEKGQVLFELEAGDQERLLGQQQALGRAMLVQLEVLGRKLDVDTGAVQQSDQAVRAELREAQALLEQAQVGENLGAQELSRVGRLHQEGLVSDSELARVRAEAEQRSSSVKALRPTLDRLEWARRLQLSDRRGDLSELRHDLARLEGELEASRAAIDRLKYLVDLRRIRASIAGTVGDLAVVEVGSFVEKGDRLATLVPDGEVKVVADFAPASAAGRVIRGQSARVRLDGFPSIQYGAISATVTRVSSEVRDGRIRVELAIDPDPPPALPLQHGLPGTVEVEVERTSPAALVLRAAGKLLGQTSVVSLQEAKN